MAILINNGSVDDIRTSLKLSENRISIKVLLNEIELEKEKLNRSTVIKMLEASIKRKRKNPTCIKCGCTNYDCRQCIKKTGRPCHWVEEDLCSACV